MKKYNIFKTNIIKSLTFILISLFISIYPLQTFAINNNLQYNNKEIINILKNKKDKTNISLLITKDTIFYDEMWAIVKFISLDIKENFLIVNAEKYPNGYKFKINNKTYTTSDFQTIVELNNAFVTPENQIITYENIVNRPKEFSTIKPNYRNNKIVEEAKSKLKTLNEGSSDFKAQLINVIKVVSEMNLSYDGDAKDQGNLEKGSTLCDGFTWIFSELLNETNIKYRYVLVSPKYNKDENDYYKDNGPRSWHIYNEVYNPITNKWISFENTNLRKDIFNAASGVTIDEKAINFYNSNLNKTSTVLEEQIYLSNKEIQRIYFNNIFVSETYLNGKPVDTKSCKVVKYTYNAGLSVNKEKLNNAMAVKKH